MASVCHMWTAPSLQELLDDFDRIACVHMSGLLVRLHMNAGQDGSRDVGSKQGDGHIGPLAHMECPTARIDRSHHLVDSDGFGIADLGTDLFQCPTRCVLAPAIWIAAITASAFFVSRPRRSNVLVRSRT